MNGCKCVWLPEEYGHQYQVRGICITPGCSVNHVLGGRRSKSPKHPARLFDSVEEAWKAAYHANRFEVPA